MDTQFLDGRGDLALLQQAGADLRDGQRRRGRRRGCRERLLGLALMRRNAASASAGASTMIGSLARSCRGCRIRDEVGAIGSLGECEKLRQKHGVVEQLFLGTVHDADPEVNSIHLSPLRDRMYSSRSAR